MAIRLLLSTPRTMRQVSVQSRSSSSALYVRAIHALVLTVLLAVAAPAGAQILETETARFPLPGHLEVGTGYEFQTSAAGTERAIPIAVELGVNDRFSLLVEPVLYTAIRPEGGPNATGLGDVEVTGTLLAVSEGVRRPAIALAAEVKIPTARNMYIGTTKTDYAGYLVASKRLGRFDTHANVGYTIVGQPAGTHLNNIVNGALAASFHASPAILLFGELLANTGATSDAESIGTTRPSVLLPGTIITPEAATGEVVGTLGIGRYVLPSALLLLSVSYDNSNATLIRPGITVSF
ncbi:MAG: hypothetical protein ACR2GG_08735 [Gemmatimonadaceae bacterium]